MDWLNTKMNKAKIINVRVVLEKILRDNEHALKEAGVSVVLGGSMRNEAVGTATINIHVLDLESTGKPINIHEKEWNQYASQFGLETAWLGKTFEMRGKKFEITGLEYKRWKRPVCIKDVVTRQDFIFPAEELKRIMRSSSGAAKLPFICSCKGRDAKIILHYTENESKSFYEQLTDCPDEVLVEKYTILRAAQLGIETSRRYNEA